MAHSLGPWHVDPPSSRWGGYEIGNAAGEMIAETQQGVAEHADARLIAAAPELLAACRDALDRLNGVDPENLSERSRGEWTALHGTLSAAIAKATTEAR